MAIIEEPLISEEEFDLIEETEPVSDISSVGRSGSPQPLPGGHYGRAFDGNRPSASGQRGVAVPNARNSLNDSYLTASTWMMKNDDAESHGAEDGPSALQYTKSMIKRMWPRQDKDQDQDLLIAVMGMTGSGKTTFVSKVTGRTDLNIGHSLTSCTRDIEVVPAKIDGRVVHFVDTPGFSDTNLSDSEVLELIAEYLATAYKNDIKLSGIIYLHPISDTRVTHHATKNLQMFQKLTGQNNLKNVVLATSMWDKVSPEEGFAREEELKRKFWNVMLAYQAKTVRYEGTEDSARSIAKTLMANKPFFLQLQNEMGRDNKTLRDTEAGRQVMIELIKLKEEHKEELANMEAMMRSSAAESKLVVDALQEHYQQKLKELERTLRDERRLNEEAVQSLQNRISALENRGSCAVM